MAMATQAQRTTELTPEGESLRIEAMGMASAIRGQLEESARREAAGEKPMLISRNSPGHVKRRLLGG